MSRELQPTAGLDEGRCKVRLLEAFARYLMRTHSLTGKGEQQPGFRASLLLAAEGLNRKQDQNQEA